MTCDVCKAPLRSNNKSGVCQRTEACKAEHGKRRHKALYRPKKPKGRKCRWCRKPIRDNNKKGLCSPCGDSYRGRYGAKRKMCQTIGCLRLVNSTTKHGYCRRCARSEVYYKPRVNVPFSFCENCDSLLAASNRHGICKECVKDPKWKRLLRSRREAARLQRVGGHDEGAGQSLQEVGRGEGVPGEQRDEGVRAGVRRARRKPKQGGDPA